ncbi:MAG TPA: class I SAM-dependent methyltransferase [Polyangiaceae bacterium]|nr:class I SAM-dependent methyltransferase [Polyangiaceae bacterium]
MPADPPAPVAGNPDARPGRDATPPGHAAAPPGHGAAPPGHGAAPPGHAAAAPGHGATPPGHGAAPPGHAAAPPGHSAAAPGHDVATPGHAAAMPGHAAAPPAEPLARIAAAIDARGAFFAPPHDRAFRLFSGFSEGYPPLTLDVYGRTLVVHDHAAGPDGDEPLARAAVGLARERLPWLRAALWKARKAAAPEARRGRWLLGAEADAERRVREHGVRYALALAAFRDASLYLDTRGLRAWARATLAGARVLNAFAHTGSLGVAARAAPAALVVHLDKSRPALTLAKDSYALNGFPVRRPDFRAADFFVEAARLRRENALFDCVFLDPPFFSSTAAGRVDLERDFNALVDKVRPLVGDGGRLVAVNNALYVSGADFERSIAALAADGYLELEGRIAVPDDVVGLAPSGPPSAPADPSPYNHSTKIAVLRVKRRDGRKASTGG